jgi:hypothetical protein
MAASGVRTAGRRISGRGRCQAGRLAQRAYLVPTRFESVTFITISNSEAPPSPLARIDELADPGDTHRGDDRDREAGRRVLLGLTRLRCDPIATG